MADYAWQHILQIILDAIESGDLAFGAKLPTTNELCETYNVSKITVKRAMDELVHQGLISRKRGSGTFVCDSPATRASEGHSWASEDKSLGYAAECAQRGLQAQARLHCFKTVYPCRAAREALALKDSEVCFQIERTLLANEDPEAVVTSYIPFQLAPDLTEKAAAHSLFSYATDVLNLTIARSLRKISAIPAPESAAAELGIDAGVPVLSITQTSFTDDGRAFEYSESIHHTNYRYFALRRP